MHSHSLCPHYFLPFPAYSRLCPLPPSWCLPSLSTAIPPGRVHCHSVLSPAVAQLENDPNCPHQTDTFSCIISAPVSSGHSLALFSSSIQPDVISILSLVLESLVTIISLHQASTPRAKPLNPMPDSASRSLSLQLQLRQSAQGGNRTKGGHGCL